MSGFKKKYYIKYSFFFIVVALLIGFLFLIHNNDTVKGVSEAYSFFIFFLILLMVLNKGSVPKLISVLISIGFVVKSIYSYFIYKTIISPFPDSFTYLSNLEIIKQSSLNIESVSSIVGSLHFGYYYFMYIISFIFNTNYSLYVVNIFLFYLSALFFYQILKDDFGEVISKVTSILFISSLNIFLFTSNILKDSLVLFLLMLSLYIYKQKKYKILCLIPVVILFTVRIYAGGAIFMAIIFDYLMSGKHSKKKTANGIFIIVIFSVVMLNLPFAFNYLEKIKSFVAGVSVPEIIVLPIISLVKFYFSPLFWNLLAHPDVYLITFIDSFLSLIFSFAILFFIIKIFKYKGLRKKIYIYVIPIYVHALALGIQYGGDSTRQRIGIYGFIILTFIIGLFYKERANLKSN